MDSFDTKGFSNPIRGQIEDLQPRIEDRPLLGREADQLGRPDGQRNDQAIGQQYQKMQKTRLSQVDETRGIIDDDDRSGFMGHGSRGPRISSSSLARGTLRNCAARTGDIISSARA